MDKIDKQKSKIFEPPKSNNKQDFEGVKKQAKEILGKFAKALEKVKTEEDFYVDREEFEREEGKGEKCENFKEELLKNAPKKDKDFVIAEKGSWK